MQLLTTFCWSRTLVWWGHMDERYHNNCSGSKILTIQSWSCVSTVDHCYIVLPTIYLSGNCMPWIISLYCTPLCMKWHIITLHILIYQESRLKTLNSSILIIDNDKKTLLLVSSSQIEQPRMIDAVEEPCQPHHWFLAYAGEAATMWMHLIANMPTHHCSLGSSMCEY